MAAPSESPDTAGPRSGGYFIAFEGPEGAGKSTQIERLVHSLTNAGVRCSDTREPGGTPTGDRIRTVILDPELEVAPMTEFLLYSASRSQLITEIVEPALARGDTVVSDRFAGASLAYQGYGRGLDRSFIRTLTDRVTGGITPDLTILLDLDPETGLERVATRGARDRLERADLQFHRRVRDGFLELAASDPTWHRLDASVPPDELQERIWNLVREHHPDLTPGSEASYEQRGAVEPHSTETQPIGTEPHSQKAEES